MSLPTKWNEFTRKNPFFHPEQGLDSTLQTSKAHLPTGHTPLLFSENTAFLHQIQAVQRSSASVVWDWWPQTHKAR